MFRFLFSIRLFVNLFFMFFALFGLTITKGGLSFYSITRLFGRYIKKSDRIATKNKFESFKQDVIKIVKIGTNFK